MPGEVDVGAIAVTLDRAAKVQRDKIVQTLPLSSRVPLKEHICTRPMRHPQITLTGFAISRIEVFDRRFINLDVSSAHHLVFDLSRPIHFNDRPSRGVPEKKVCLFGIVSDYSRRKTGSLPVSAT